MQGDVYKRQVIDVHIHHFYLWIINFGYYLFDERSLAHASGRDEKDVYKRQIVLLAIRRSRYKLLTFNCFNVFIFDFHLHLIKSLAIHTRRFATSWAAATRLYR